jgi:hypothetical protein
MFGLTQVMWSVISDPYIACLTNGMGWSASPSPNSSVWFSRCSFIQQRVGNDIWREAYPCWSLPTPAREIGLQLRKS